MYCACRRIGGIGGKREKPALTGPGRGAIAYMKKVVLILIALYQNYASVLLRHVLGPGNGCRYEMTCSVYAARAIEKHGVGKGSLLAAKRIFSCRPHGGKQYATI